MRHFPDLKAGAFTLLIAAATFLMTGSANGQCEYELIQPHDWRPSSYGSTSPTCPPQLFVRDDLAIMTCRHDAEGGMYEKNFRESSVHVMREVDGTWALEAILIDPLQDLTPRCDTFGSMVAIHDGRIAIGAHREFDLEIYIYAFNGSTWDIESTLTYFEDYAPGLGTLHRDLIWNDTGIYVAIRRAIGPSLRNMVMHLSEKSPGSWFIEQEIAEPAGPTSDTAFGMSIRIDGNTMAIGAPHYPVGGGIQGRVYLFNWNGTEWQVDGSIEATNSEDHLLGNRQLCLKGGTLVAATPYGRDYPGEDGWVHIYERLNQREWNHQQQLDIPSIPTPYGGPPSFLYNGLDFDGEHIAVSRAAFTSTSSGGELYVAHRASDTWSIGAGVRPNGDKQNLPNTHPPHSCGFGCDVAFHDDIVFILGHQRQALSTGTGRPSLFSYTISDDLGADLNSNGICDDIDFMTGLFLNDLNLNGIEDELEIQLGISTDCNQNLIPDNAEEDCDGDGVPDACEDDCNDNLVPDDCESVYDFDREEAVPGSVLGLLDYHAATLMLRPIEIAAGSEHLSSITIHKGLVYDDTTGVVVVYRDHDQDGDVSNATLSFSQQVSFADLRHKNGIVVDLSDLYIGEPNEIAYIGMAIQHMRHDELYYLSDFPDDNHLGSILLTRSHQPIDLSDLSAVDLHWIGPHLHVAFEAHFGPRPTCCLSTDFDNDGVTDATDLQALFTDWGPCEDVCETDVNHDHVIDAQDLILLLKFWGACE